MLIHNNCKLQHKIETVKNFTLVRSCIKVTGDFPSMAGALIFM